MHAALTSFCLCFGVWWVVSVPIVVAADSCILLSNPLHLRMLISFNIYTEIQSMNLWASHLQSLAWICALNISAICNHWLGSTQFCVLRGSPQKVTKLGSTPKSGTVMLFSNGLRPTAIVGETQSCWSKEAHVLKATDLCLWKYRNEELSTVDGRHPAPQGKSSLSHYLQGFLHPRWLAGFLPSSVYQGNPVEYVLLNSGCWIIWMALEGERQR